MNGLKRLSSKTSRAQGFVNVPCNPHYGTIHRSSRCVPELGPRATTTKATLQNTIIESTKAANVHDTIPARFSNIVDIAKQTKEIRERFCKEYVAGGLVYLEAGEQVKRNGGDVYYRYRPASDFFYLTGVSEAGCACLIDTETGG